MKSFPPSLLSRFFHLPICSIAILLGICSIGCSSATVAGISESNPQSLPPLTQETQPQSRGQMLPISAQATVRDQLIQLEVAQTPEQQAMGLMFRPALPDDRGMLFPFNPPRPVSFWMKNVPVPLDMIFLREGEVKAIEQRVPPCHSAPSECPTYGPDPDIEIDRVIELRSGRAEELGLEVGDRIEIEWLRK